MVIYTLSLHDALPIYQQNIQQYSNPEQVRASHILLKTEGKDEKGVEEVKKKAEDLRSEEHTSELQSRRDLVCRLLLEKKSSPQRSSTSGYMSRRPRGS